jgi:hypothetical protein
MKRHWQDIISLMTNAMFQMSFRTDKKIDPKQETSPNAKSINYPAESALITLDRRASCVKYHQSLLPRKNTILCWLG